MPTEAVLDVKIYRCGVCGEGHLKEEFAVKCEEKHGLSKALYEKVMSREDATKGFVILSREKMYAVYVKKSVGEWSKEFCVDAVASNDRFEPIFFGKEYEVLDLRSAILAGWMPPFRFYNDQAEKIYGGVLQEVYRGMLGGECPEDCRVLVEKIKEDLLNGKARVVPKGYKSI